MSYIYLLVLSCVLLALTVKSLTLAPVRNETRLTSTYMDCGSTPYCGIIVLERGGGPSAYAHSEPCLHGLWPEVPSYGDSLCVSPLGNVNASVSPYMLCYTDASFATHEWQAHGYCASSTPQDFFNQACNLSYGPLATMTTMKTAGATVQDMASEFTKEGYQVWYVDTTNDQVELVVCAGSNKVWKYSTIANFPINCPK